MPHEFAGRVVIVTGAGKGIGQATAIAFSKLGAHVVLSGQNKEPLMQTLGLIEERGGRGVVVVGDVATEEAAREAVSVALKEFGRLDFAVNNAGVSPWTGNTVECTLETWQRVIGVNLTGTWLGMKLTAFRKDEHRFGRIPWAIVNAGFRQRLRFPPCHSRPKYPAVALQCERHSPWNTDQGFTRESHAWTVNRSVLLARDAPPYLLRIAPARSTTTRIVGVAEHQKHHTAGLQTTSNLPKHPREIPHVFFNRVLLTRLALDAVIALPKVRRTGYDAVDRRVWKTSQDRQRIGVHDGPRQVVLETEPMWGLKAERQQRRRRRRRVSDA